MKIKVWNTEGTRPGKIVHKAFTTVAAIRWIFQSAKPGRYYIGTNKRTAFTKLKPFTSPK